MYFNMDVKLRNRTEFQNSVLHNHRKEKEPKKNIDYSRTKDNFYIIGSNDENKMDYALKIDNSAVSSCVVLPHENSLSLTGNWTVEFWFKINSWGGTTTQYPYMFLKSGANYFVFLRYFLCIVSLAQHLYYIFSI